MVRGLVMQLLGLLHDRGQGSVAEWRAYKAACDSNGFLTVQVQCETCRGKAATSMGRRHVQQKWELSLGYYIQHVISVN